MKGQVVGCWSGNSHEARRPLCDPCIVLLRGVRDDELEKLKQLRLRALQDSPGAFGSRFEEEAPRDPNSWLPWVAEGGTFVIEDDLGWYGMVAVFLDGSDSSVCHLVSMWVDPGQRGQGFGGQSFRGQGFGGLAGSRSPRPERNAKRA